ncbi:ABC transporter ATP-binding protein [Fictibacillus sp. Mic-4]|uniref:ABC transporter ATP-binding protein n=1 Tax=Fictibacillus sp. Mic-4 TaxID=3132826 RepID=UPI003CF51D1A
MIEFKNVSKRYWKHQALTDVTFTLPSGKIIGIVGENGSGKSTTLKLMAGLICPTKGTVIVNGVPMDRRMAKAVSYLSELDVYYPFTVEETIQFYASQFADFSLERADEIAAFMKLDRKKRVKSLSKGSRGRLKMVLTLAREAPVILMDEPFSGLDPMVRDAIVKSLISFLDIEHRTIVITTHELKEIEPLLDMAVALKEGELIGIRDVEELRDDENLSIVDWMKQQYE